MSKSTVAVRFSGDVTDLKNKLADVEGKMSGLGSKLATVGTAAAAGMAVAGAAVVGFAAKSADTFSKVGGEVLKLSRYTGATAEEASRLRFAGTQAGIGVDTMTKSLGLLSKGLAGTKFDKLGLDLKNADGTAKPLNESLLTIATRFQSMPNGAEKTALAMQLFGRAGADMIPFLNRGADGIKELEAQSDKFGNTLSGKDLEAVKESTANHRLFTAAMQGLQIQIGRYVLPIVEKFVSFLATNMPAAIGFVRKVMEGLQPAFTAVGDVIEIVRRGVMDFIGTWQNFQDGTTSAGNFGKIEEAAIRLREAFNAVVAWIQQNWPQIEATISTVLGDVQAVIQGAVGVISALWNTFGDTILNAIQRVWPPIEQIVRGVMETIQGVIDVITGIIHGNWSQVWDGIREIFHGVWNEMLGIVKAIMEQIRLGIALAWTGIKTVFSGALTAIKNAVTTGFGDVVSFFKGLPKRMLDALGDVSKLLEKAGLAIMQSLYDGLQERYGPLLDFVSRIAGSVADQFGGGLGLPGVSFSSSGGQTSIGVGGDGSALHITLVMPNGDVLLNHIVSAAELKGKRSGLAGLGF